MKERMKKKKQEPKEVLYIYIPGTEREEESLEISSLPVGSACMLALSDEEMMMAILLISIR